MFCNKAQIYSQKRVEPKSHRVTDDIKETTSQMNNFIFLATKPGKQTWIIDSGGSSRISNNESLFTQTKNTNKTSVIIVNGKILISYGSGDIKIETKTSEG